MIFHLPEVRPFFWILVPAAFYQRIHLSTGDRAHEGNLARSQEGCKLTSNSFSESVSKFKSGLKLDVMILDSFSVGEVKLQILLCSYFHSIFPSGGSGSSNLACTVGARGCVECALPQDDLMSNDGKAVDVSFLRGPLFPQVFWCCPQV